MLGATRVPGVCGLLLLLPNTQSLHDRVFSLWGVYYLSGANFLHCPSKGQLPRVRRILLLLRFCYCNTGVENIQSRIRTHTVTFSRQITLDARVAVFMSPHTISLLIQRILARLGTMFRIICLRELVILVDIVSYRRCYGQHNFVRTVHLS